MPPGNLVLLWGDPELGGKSLGEMARTGKSAQIRYFGDVFSLFVEKPSGALQTLPAQDAEDSVLEEHPEQGRVRLTPTAAASSGKLGGFPISWSSMA